MLAEIHLGRGFDAFDIAAVGCEAEVRRQDLILGIVGVVSERPENLILLLRKIVPTYYAPEVVNRQVVLQDAMKYEEENVDETAYPRKVEESV